jgi:L-aspartate oxidase
VQAHVDGRTAVAGLWAIGEVARTGLHGANRLASNSLLECVVMARSAALRMAEQPLHRPAAIHHRPRKSGKSLSAESQQEMRQALQQLMLHNKQPLNKQPLNRPPHLPHNKQKKHVLQN